MMVLRHRLWLALALGSTVLFLASARAQPIVAPSTRPASPATASAGVELHEWVVLVCDRNQPQVNARTTFRSTLPPFVGTRRPSAEQDERAVPQPVGVIRLIGASAEKIDVLLEMKGGTFIAHWPKARTKPNRLLWQNVELRAPNPAAGAAAASEPGDGDHWFTALRGAAAPELAIDGRGERFLLYDVELNYPLPLGVESDNGATDRAGPWVYKVGNISAAPAHDLVLYKNVGGTWHVGGLDKLAASAAPATAPAATQTANGATTAPVTPDDVLAAVAPAAAPTTAPAPTVVAVAPAAAPVTAPATMATTVAATGPTTQAATQPAFVGTNITLAPGPAQPAELLAPWRQTLSAAGLAPTDTDLILRVLEAHALDPQRLTAIYRLDAGELDRLLPLDVTPTPRRTVRVGLVVVRGIDPAITEEIDGLIAQLGDPDWNVRERAYKQLAEFGALAQPKLTAATKQKDLEVVYRAERLLQRLTNPAANPQ